MKLELTEGDYGIEINLSPENMAELAQLLRFSMNARKEKPTINFNFINDKPYCNIWLKKISPDKQKNNIYND